MGLYSQISLTYCLSYAKATITSLTANLVSAETLDAVADESGRRHCGTVLEYHEGIVLPYELKKYFTVAG